MKGVVIMKRKLAIICICAFVAAGISTGIISSTNSEADVDNRKSVESVEKVTSEKDVQTESDQQKFDDKQAVDKNLDNAVTGKSHVAKGNGRSIQYKANTESKESLPEKISTKSPVHIHDWEPVVKTETVKNKVPIYGDVCRSCNKIVTGWADKHLLESDCTGYDTDVIVSYEEVTEKVTYTVYECNCGAIK